jgi:methionyl-tRNA formyltransferase
MTLTLIFMGTPEFAVPTLGAVLDAGHRVLAVYCQPPRPAGRGMTERKSPVQGYAERRAIPVRTPKSLKDSAEQREFAALKADAAVIVAYGLLLPIPILEAPRLGCYNLHASRLPRWRGAAPIQRAIMAGDTETAVTVMRMEAGLDTGPVCLAESVAIGPDTTASELHDELSHRGARLMVRALDALEQGRLEATPQSEQGVTYAAKIDKAEGHIDFRRPAREVHNLIRALSPHPGAWFEAAPAGRGKERIRALRSVLTEGKGRPGEVLDDRLTIACGEGAVRLTVLQRAGKQALSAAEFLRGLPLAGGTILDGSR